ncbi:prolyl oligopeptidase family serine peptidase [Paenibacillus sp. LMG 31456]|uniref:Prolyl oligopeptidase family serine peptidase n=1 Tax=Paenibacillus foliorum TaxID=2654974 RepID=A0A972GPN7_9BACL|nr:alpha/beta hydrolase family protein [Paenibacillus foliorum]NOU92114.1 prolyl oligopeptidase family serine peptidase [Paenibacillus foliorum]
MKREANSTMWNPDEYLRQLYETRTGQLSFQAKNRSEWLEWQSALTEKFIDSLGGFETSKPDLQPRELERVEFDDYIRERIEITTAESLRMPVYVLLPKGKQGKLPVVIGCHGHGYGSKAAVGLLADGTEAGDVDPDVHHTFALSLVKRGFAVVVPELIGFGDRKLENEVVVNSSTNSCFPIGVFLLMLGKTIAGVRIQETMAAIDYVSSRSEMDASRIGIFGLSGGGLVSAFTAALDQRIRAAVVSCYTNTFLDSILSMRHCVDNYIPNVLRYAEMPDLIGLIAPRPLFIEAGREDKIFPLHGTEKALAQLQAVYQTAGVPDSLDSDLFPGGHEVYGKHSFPWLEKQLMK